MYEIEIKLKVESFKGLIEKLKRFKKREVLQKDVYYQHPCKNFGETDEALRLRIVDSIGELTYKGPRVKSKVKKRVEIIVKTSDVNELKKLLERLGFKPIAEIVKKRLIYEYKGVEVCLDEVQGLGFFIELEGKSEEDVLKVLKELRIEGKIEDKTYLELYLNRMRE